MRKTTALTAAANQPLAVETIQRRDLRSNDVAIDVTFCGVCHSDLDEIHRPGNKPLVAGHEFVGTVVALGETAGIPSKWEVGDLVGGAWHGGHDGHCRSCSRGDFQMCTNKQINGVTRDGGVRPAMALDHAHRAPTGEVISIGDEPGADPGLVQMRLEAHAATPVGAVPTGSIR